MGFQPKITIVTPSYNQAQFIEDNLNSVKHQDYQHIEHIVIDGGSTDHTVELLKEYEDQYNLRWISETDRGQSHAINKGINMATGDWIGWQNSDDYYLPNSISKFTNVIKQNNDIDVIYGDVIVVNQDGTELDKIFNIPPSCFVQRYWTLFTSNQSTFFKKSVFDTVGPINENLDLTMDAELFWRLIRYNMSMYHIPEFLGALRKQPNAKTHNQSFTEAREELQKYYYHPWYENCIPNILLQNSAKCMKAYYLAKQNRWEAFSHNLKQIIN